MDKKIHATGVCRKSLHNGDCLGQLNRSDDHTSEIKILEINPDTVDSGGFKNVSVGFFTQDALMVLAMNAKVTGIGNPTRK